ncbi:hypothetical protein U2088_15470, partial [Listeria monocytogenes]
YSDSEVRTLRAELANAKELARNFQISANEQAIGGGGGGSMDTRDRGQNVPSPPPSSVYKSQTEIDKEKADVEKAQKEYADLIAKGRKEID